MHDSGRGYGRNVAARLGRQHRLVATERLREPDSTRRRCCGWRLARERLGRDCRACRRQTRLEAGVPAEVELRDVDGGDRSGAARRRHGATRWDHPRAAGCSQCCTRGGAHQGANDTRKSGLHGDTLAGTATGTAACWDTAIEELGAAPTVTVAGDAGSLR